MENNRCEQTIVGNFFFFFFSATTTITEQKNINSPASSIGQETAEEGRSNKMFEGTKEYEKIKTIEIRIETASNTTINYPVGKPLEVNRFIRS